MPAKTEKQKKFFGAAMGAKKGQKNVSGEAKKVAKELPKKEIKKFLKKGNEEDEESVSKQIKKTGKAIIKGPNVKERKKFAPPTKVEKSKKTYDRKKETFDESCNISKFVEAILTKNYSTANKHLKQAVEAKLAERIQSELNTPLF